LLGASSIIGNWFFRMELAHTRGKEDEMLYSWSQGQALDIIEGAGSNLRNLALHLPGPTVPGLSPANRYASNTINVWLNSAAYQGIPRILLVVVALALISVAVYSFVSLRRMSLQNSAPAL